MGKNGLIDLSIIIPARNEEEYIASCIAAFKSFRNIEYEVIVVDSGSQDKTVAIAKSQGATVIELGQKTIPGKARNRGAQSAIGRVLAFIDADVIVSDQWIERVTNLIHSNDEILQSSVMGDTYQNSISGSLIEKYWFTEMRKYTKSYINGGNILLLRENFDCLGGFSNSLETGEDVELCERAKSKGLNIVLDEALFVHHEGNPKQFGQFIQRERWHGIGDLDSWALFFKSKVAIVSVVFALSHILLFFYLAFHAFMPAFLVFLFISALCLLLSVLKFRDSAVEAIAFNAVVYYFYMLGRSLSLVDKLIKSKQTATS